MDMIQIQQVAKKYRELLPIKAVSVLPERVFPRPQENLTHCAWMCDQIIDGTMDRDKAMRWLCFVQGCLWTLGCKSILEMKDDNRSEAVESSSPAA